MKKTFFLLFIFLQIFCITACSLADYFGWNEEEEDTEAVTKVTIKNMSSYDIYYRVSEDSGYSYTCVVKGSSKTFVDGEYGTSLETGSQYVYLQIEKDSGTIYCHTADLFKIEDKKDNEITITNNTIVIDNDNTAKRNTLALIGQPTEFLKIINNSNYDLINVTYKSIVFSSNPIDPILEAGSSSKNHIELGYGYVYFTIKSNNFMARTKKVLTIDKTGETTFEITDDTEIVEQYNENNSGTIADCQKQIVFCDDAEGARQPYNLMRNVSYSEREAYEGKKSVYLGSDARLEKSLKLEKKAEISFWYDSDTTTDNFTGYHYTNSIRIGDLSQYLEPTDWVKFEYTIEAGEYTLNIETEDGRYNCLYIDNLVICYVE